LWAALPAFEKISVCSLTSRTISASESRPVPKVWAITETGWATPIA